MWVLTFLFSFEMCFYHLWNYKMKSPVIPSGIRQWEAGFLPCLPSPRPGGTNPTASVQADAHTWGEELPNYDRIMHISLHLSLFMFRDFSSSQWREGGWERSNTISILTCIHRFTGYTRLDHSVTLKCNLLLFPCVFLFSLLLPHSAAWRPSLPPPEGSLLQQHSAHSDLVTQTPTD